MHRGVVAAGHELTVQAAESILLAGGNAFDAVLAAHFAACVVEPVLASLGGGGFMIGKTARNEPVVYDFFVQTPRSKRPTAELSFAPVVADFGTAQQQFHIGMGTVATPGTVRGVFAIHRDLGSMSLVDIASPAINCAREGVAVDPVQAYIFDVVHAIYLSTSESRQHFADATGREVLREGAILRRPALADTIEQLVLEGEDLFYRGEIGEQIVALCNEQGGHLTRDDLEGYQVSKRKPLIVPFCGSRVFTNPPPSSAGLLIAFALELLTDTYQTGSMSPDTELCLLAEVMALTNKARIDTLAESGSHTDPTELINSDYLARYRQEIVQRAAALRGTTQISIIDAEQNVASMTVSNGEGCGVMVPNTGFMLNNMLGESDLNIKGFHLWNEDERMTSMMAPTIISRQDGAVVATGSGGSNRIRTALLQVINNLLHFEMELSGAVRAPRIHVEGDKLSVEGGMPPEELEPLLSRYPDREIWEDLNLFFGGAHSVLARNGTLEGAGDPRRGGVSRVL